ncbi:MAG: ClpXP protease specificity-enhancing factor [Burkholderiales bacterium]
MTLPTQPVDAGTSTRPYLIRALHEWCTENGFTPYVAVFVDASVRVPPEYVKNNEIVLNIGLEATNALRLCNEFIEFKARFGGTAREIAVPVTHVIAIYARENGQGMAFPAPSADAGASVELSAVAADAKRVAPHLTLADETASPTPTKSSTTRPAKSPEPPEPPPSPGRPSLKRVK